MQNILKCGRPGGGGWSVISDTPGRGGEGGSKKGKFLRTSFMDGPLVLLTNDMYCPTNEMYCLTMRCIVLGSLLTRLQKIGPYRFFCQLYSSIVTLIMMRVS